MNNLQVLLPTSTSLSVNESANSLILVATKRDIKRMLKVVHALDTSIASVSTIKVFQLRYADAKQMATEIQTLFAPQGTQGAGGPGAFRAQLFNMFRGGGFGPGGPGGPGGAGGTSSAGNGAQTAKVSATSDDYSNSLIVSAPSDMMQTISDMVQQIDVPTTDVTELRVFELHHADAVELADQISQLFPDTSKTSDNNAGGGGGFRFGGPFGFGRGNNQATSSDRNRKKSQVIAVADPRTQRLMVTAASELMPHIAQMIAELDSVDARHEVVKVFDLKNADPQDVNQVLADLFNRSGQMRSSSSSSSQSLLGTRNPLTQRETATITSPSTQTTSSGRGAAGINTGF